MDRDALEAIPLDRPVSLDSLLLHAELLNHASRGGVAKEVARLDSVQTEHLEAEIDNALAGLGRVTALPTLDGNPIPELGAVVNVIDHKADCAGQTSRRVVDDSESGIGSLVPGRSMRRNPLRRSAVRIWMRDVECRIGDLAHAGEPLDVERVVGNERAKRETLGGECRLDAPLRRD